MLLFALRDASRHRALKNVWTFFIGVEWMKDNR